jgi:hypothetical protein
MENGGNRFPEHARATLRIKRLLATQLKLFRLEVVGQDHPLLVRIGALLVFGPFLLVGYAFAWAGWLRLLAIRVGWGVGLLLFGLVHLAVGAWGLRRGHALIFSQSYQVVAPECEAAVDLDNAITLPSFHPPGARRGHPAGSYLRPLA